MMRGLTLLGLGAGLMYFLDPERGRRRRALARDQLDHTVHELDHTIQVTSRDLNNRLQGLVHNVQGPFTNGDAPDRVLEERIRSAMGRIVSHPRAVSVIARGGHVTLRGPILTSEAKPLFDAALGTSGVRGVDNQLELHDEPGSLPALQGGKTRTGMRPELFQENRSPATKFLLGTAAAGMLWKLAGRRSPIRVLMALAGAGLVARVVALNTGGGGMSRGRPARRGRGEDPEVGMGWGPGYDESYPPTPVL